MFLSALLTACIAAPIDTARPFEFKDGDRIVWLGSTLVEREQRYGYWETALLAANADKHITLRNLGWSGDTVHGEARGRFDFSNPDKCFQQIVDQALAIKPPAGTWLGRITQRALDTKYSFKPTVIFISYGTNESFEGKEGLAKFEKGLEKLLDALKPANARIVLFSPMPFEYGVPEERNRDVALYAGVIRKVAEKRSLWFIDPGVALAREFESRPKPGRLTDNGMHLSEDGYRLTAPAVIASLGLKAPELDWKKLDPLRKAVVEKNQLFFYHWRPQNETYLFGFRKHEQGNNANEVAEFNPLVAKAEAEIARLVKELKK